MACHRTDRVGRMLTIAATCGHPCLGVAISIGWKVGEGANRSPIGVDQLHSIADAATGESTRYKDHWNVIKFDIGLWVVKMFK